MSSLDGFTKTNFLNGILSLNTKIQLALNTNSITIVPILLNVILGILILNNELHKVSTVAILNHDAIDIQTTSGRASSIDLLALVTHNKSSIESCGRLHLSTIDAVHEATTNTSGADKLVIAAIEYILLKRCVTNTNTVCLVWITASGNRSKTVLHFTQTVIRRILSTITSVTGREDINRNFHLSDGTI